MKKKTVTRITAFLLLIATIICIVIGIIKWPGLVTGLGLTYRQVPMAMITDLHDWSGLVMAILAAVHVNQFRGMLKSMARILMPLRDNNE